LKEASYLRFLKSKREQDQLISAQQGQISLHTYENRITNLLEPGNKLTGLQTY